MIKLFSLLCLFSCLVPAFSQQLKYKMPSNPRIEKTINNNWTFNYFPEKEAPVGIFASPGYEDSKWTCISLPHTWQTYETTRELHPYIRSASADDDPYWWKGWGCYRKHLVVGKEYAGKKIYFEFDGVQKYAKIYLNGKYLGDHKGGYTSFYIDATDAIQFGADNLLSVAVNNLLKDSLAIAPMSAGNFDVYGGIHRDVRIVIKDQLNIPFQGSWLHEGGTFITTPKVNDQEATVQVKTFVQNNNKTVKNVRLITHLIDSAGMKLQRMETSMQVEPGQVAEFVQKEGLVKRPKLWSPDSPYIYKAVSEVYADNTLTDCFISHFGIRTFSWDFNLHRLILNGKITHLHGINRHEEYIWLGGAFPKWIAQRDMLDIDNGLEANFMRTAHYPQDPSIYKFTDLHGICINEELPNIKKLEFNDKIQAQNCIEMIRRDRNHPSILFWSMGNETTDACDSRVAWKEDTTRILTVRQPYNESYNPAYVKHTDKEMALESFLRCTIKGWYDTDDKDLEPEDNQWTGTEEWQHARSDKEVISEHNGAVWLYADHGADREYVGAPLKHVNPKGWVDSWRTPKYAYYQWQANFAKKPMVFLHPHFWRKQYIGQKKELIVDSNCESVELFVNGKSKGILNPLKSNNFCVRFTDILIEEGTIEAIGVSKDGSKIAHRVIMAGEPAALVIIPTTKSMFSTPENVMEFKVDIVDKHGVHVIGANNALRFSVDGPAKLVGPDLYTSDRDKTEQFEGTMYIDTPVTNLIRATGEAGKVTVTVSSPGLKSASARIEIIPWIDPHPVRGISEPALNPGGRLPVAVNLKKANFIKAPPEMREYTGELRFPVAEKENYPQLVRSFLVKQNHGINTATPDFKYLTDALVNILNATGSYTGEYGYIVADDYNFVAAQYNLSRAITRNIASKKLPESYKMELITYYAKIIIGNGEDKNFMGENELINQIPEGGREVIVQDQGDLKGVIYTKETDLRLLLLEHYPQIADFKKDDLKKLLTMITNINPYVTLRSVKDKKTKDQTNTYRLTPGRFVLIPDEGKWLKTKFPDRKI